MMSVFSRILDLIFPPRRKESLIRATSLEEIEKLVKPSLSPDGTVTLLPYRAPLIQTLMTEAKFKGNGKAQELLGTVLATYLKGLSLENSVLVPIPLSTKRERERGYNQVERILAEAQMKLPPLHTDGGLLVRTRDTQPQTTLDAVTRPQNVTGAFLATRAPDPAYTYIVVDDVMTTGATLKEAAGALRDAGAGDVKTLALAH